MSPAVHAPANAIPQLLATFSFLGIFGMSDKKSILASLFVTYIQEEVKTLPPLLLAGRQSKEYFMKKIPERFYISLALLPKYQG